jgi:carbonic anhydrase
MNRKFSVLCAVFLALFLALPAFAAHWTYEGLTGPDYWEGLNPDYGLAVGDAQSPIDVETSLAEGHHGKELRVHYRDGAFTVINNGHTIQFAPLEPVQEGKENFITLDGERYDLAQFHSHVPAEHKVNGATPGMEFHFVHRSEGGRLAVMALHFDEGPANETLASVWNEIPTRYVEGESPRPLEMPFAITSLLPRDLKNIQYNGSLTTPPTTEGVLWIVLEKRASANTGQIARLGAVIGPNARPVQPRNGRLLYTGEGGKD